MLGMRRLTFVVIIAQLFLAMVGTLGESRDEGMDEAISARWFYERGLALQVADNEGPANCLRCFQTAARLLSDRRTAIATQVDGGESLDQAHLYSLVQNASREVSLRAKARRVGGTLMLHTEIHDSIGPVPLSWWLGDDLRDVADFACCAGMYETPPRCLEDVHLLASSQSAPAAGGERSGEGDDGENSTCTSYVLKILIRSEEDFRDRIMNRPAGAARPPRYMPPQLEDDFLEECQAGLAYMYRDDSYPTYYQRYTRPYLEAMAAMVRRRGAGTNYPSVDQLLYRLLSDQAGGGGGMSVWKRIQANAVNAVNIRAIRNTRE